MTFTIDLPEGFKFVSLHIMYDGRYCVGVKHPNEKFMMGHAYGIGYGATVEEATSFAIERTLFVMNAKTANVDDSGFRRAETNYKPSLDGLDLTL